MALLCVGCSALPFNFSKIFSRFSASFVLVFMSLPASSHGHLIGGLFCLQYRRRRSLLPALSSLVVGCVFLEA